MPFRLLVTDIDGTLTDAAGRISQTTIEALHRLQDAGVGVTLATGRGEAGAAPVMDACRITLPVILYNGAQVRTPQGRVLLERRLPAADALRAMDLLRRRGLEIACAIDGSLWAERPARKLRRYLFTPESLRQARSLTQRVLASEGVTKILALGEPPWLPAALRALRAAGFNTVQSEPDALEVLPMETSKGAALHFLAGYLGVSTSEIVAVGNAPNDLELLQEAGLGVAVGSAHPAVLAVAQMVTLPSHQDGVARIVEALFHLPASSNQSPSRKPSRSASPAAISRT